MLWFYFIRNSVSNISACYHFNLLSLLSRLIFVFTINKSKGKPRCGLTSKLWWSCTFPLGTVLLRMSSRSGPWHCRGILRGLRGWSVPITNLEREIGACVGLDRSAYIAHDQWCWGNDPQQSQQSFLVLRAGGNEEPHNPEYAWEASQLHSAWL